MSASLSELHAAYDRALAYAGEAGDLMEGHVSEFWAEILAGRANYPSFDDMLLMRRGFTYPMAERRDAADQEAELAYARAAYTVATRSIPAGFLAGLEEPAFGAPQSFDFDGRRLTANCLVNAITVHRVLEALREAGIAGRPLRVLEIGAGFGQAARQLIERLDVRTYAICDLPENLFLSAFYLQALFPDRHAGFGADAGAGLAFAVPPHASRLRGPFDLVLNSYSFQEMSRASVEEYFALAAATLAPDGVFYSLNSHGKDEIAWPSDYPVGRFRLGRIRSPRRFPFQWNATVPYELVLRPGGEGVPALDAGLDAIGCAFQLGLDEELEPLCDSFARGALTAEEARWVEALSGLFRAGDPGEKRAHADALGASPVASYLQGCLAYATGDQDEAAHLLAEALPGLGSSLARVHAEAMLGRVSDVAPHLTDQLADALLNPEAYAGHIGACLRLAPREPDALGGRLRRNARRIRSRG